MAYTSRTLGLVVTKGPHHYAIVMDAEYIRIICEGLPPTRSKQSEEFGREIM